MKQGVRGGPLRVWRDEEDGFALPSVLFLVTIFGIIAASLLALGFLRRKDAITEIAHLKAEYAARNGITRLVAEIKSGVTPEDSLWDHPVEYSFDDGRSTAIVKTIPWGMYNRVESRGEAQSIRKIRTALLGERPDGGLTNALLFAHPSHQVVITGEFRIRGDVVTGSPGITTGTLRDYSTPLRLPVEGKVTSLEQYELPVMNPASLKRHLADVRDELASLDEPGPGIVNLHAAGETHLSKEAVTDTAHTIIIHGEAIFDETYPERATLHSIIVQGSLTIGASARLLGSYKITSTGGMSIQPGAAIDGAVLTSFTEIRIEPGTSLSLQCIAPRIDVGESVSLRYPSVLLSHDPSGLDSASQSLSVRTGAQVEGFVGLSSMRLGEPQDDLLRIAPGVRITGVVYSNTRIQCDGEIVGTVLTNDLYFYEEPTIYLGWLRRGSIDRVNLPNWCSAPSGLPTSRTLTIVRWL